MRVEERQVVEFGELLRILRKRQRMAGAIVLLVVVGGLLMNRQEPSVYVAVSKVICKQPQRISLNPLNPNERSSLPGAALETRAKSVSTLPVAELAAKHMAKGNVRLLPAVITRSVTAEIEPPDLIRISARASTPRLARVIADNVAYAFVEKEIQKAWQNRAFLQREEKIWSQRVTDAARRMERFKQKEGISDFDEEVKARQSRVFELESTLATLRGDMQASQAQIALLQRRLRGERETKTATKMTDSPVFAALKEQMAQLQSELVVAQSRYSPTHPQVVSLQAQVEKLQAHIAQMANKTISVKEQVPNPAFQEVRRSLAEEEAKVVSLQARLQALEALYQRERDALTRLQPKAIEFQRLTRDLTMSEAFYKEVHDRLYTVENVEAQSSDVSVFDLATEPTAPSNPPSLRRLGLAFMLGLIVAVTVALTIEYLDNTLRTPDEVRQHVQLPLLGTVPYRTKPSGALATLSEPQSPASEAYRMLRSNLKFTSLDHPVRTMVVTSSAPGEGKTITVANLAVALAQAGRRVLLVDADMRRPRLHLLFGVPNKVGLTSLLVGDADPDQAVVATDVDNLRLLACGPLPPNPSELLDSERMNALLERLKAEADIVLFDAPPALAVTDAVLLSARVDGVLFVVEAGKTARDIVRETRRLIENARGRILGIVLNKVRFNSDGYYRQYQRYYRSYQREREQTREG